MQARRAKASLLQGPARCEWPQKENTHLRKLLQESRHTRGQKSDLALVLIERDYLMKFNSITEPFYFIFFSRNAFFIYLVYVLLNVSFITNYLI